MTYISSTTLENYKTELEGLAEGLLDASSTIISSAIERGETKPPQVDKLVNQALRAVNKAINCLEKAEAQNSSGDMS